MRILAIGDVCGGPGVDYFVSRIGAMKRELKPDLTVVNGENANIRGLTPAQADMLLGAGADVLTLGNHTYDDRGILNMLDESRYIIRPANMPSQRPGRGYTTIDVQGRRVGVINLIGRVNLDYMASDPFAMADRLLAEIDADCFIVDFHAEATSEKKAMAYHLDGRASVLFGTHTHIPTADEQVLAGGLGYITDLGMTGGLDSVIGMDALQSLERFRGHLTARFKASDKNVQIQGAVFDLGPDGKCQAVRRIQY